MWIGYFECCTFRHQSILNERYHTNQLHWRRQLSNGLICIWKRKFPIQVKHTSASAQKCMQQPSRAACDATLSSLGSILSICPIQSTSVAISRNRANDGTRPSKLVQISLDHTCRTDWISPYNNQLSYYGNSLGPPSTISNSWILSAFHHHIQRSR